MVLDIALFHSCVLKQQTHTHMGIRCCLSSKHVAAPCPSSQTHTHTHTNTHARTHTRTHTHTHTHTLLPPRFGRPLPLRTLPRSNPHTRPWQTQPPGPTPPRTLRQQIGTTVRFACFVRSTYLYVCAFYPASSTSLNPLLLTHSFQFLMLQAHPPLTPFSLANSVQFLMRMYVLLLCKLGLYASL